MSDATDTPPAVALDPVVDQKLALPPLLPPGVERRGWQEVLTLFTVVSVFGILAIVGLAKTGTIDPSVREILIGFTVALLGRTWKNARDRAGAERALSLLSPKD